MSRTNRSRIVLGSIAGAFAIHIAALACSGNGSAVGGPERDAATATHDGGFIDDIVSAVDAAVHDVATKLIDGEVRDAHAGGGTVVEVACDQETTLTGTQITDAGVPYGYATTTFYGIVPGATVNSRTVPRITAYVCDPEVLGTPPAPCAAGYRCETTGTPLPASGNCVAYFTTVANDGRVIAMCGSRYVSTTGGTSSTTTTTGTRYRRAFVRIE